MPNGVFAMGDDAPLLERGGMEGNRGLKIGNMLPENCVYLNEEEELTHFGQSLAALEKMNDPVDSDSDTEERGALSAELTAAHFGGGGLLRKKALLSKRRRNLKSQNTERAHRGADCQIQVEKISTRSHYCMMSHIHVSTTSSPHFLPCFRVQVGVQPLIYLLVFNLDGAKMRPSRLRTTKRRRVKERGAGADEKLERRKAIGIISQGSKIGEEVETKSKADDYDVMVRQLVFDMKAKPSDKMKSEGDLANEEQERLQRLEAERLRRMRGEDDKAKNKPKHTSADDLMDGFILDKDDRLMLSYKDGKINLPESDDSE
ncbi:unnamed protein product [Ranitomeya imitator]|uniref:Uncharacterized protein n=1 Tax=Ranitomeya imitator TaxID=111125 RepID=A0ABN9LXK9_9NEOB|nr:unnamed protein product [Ranitomeya imitator]